ncbi:MAG TPA: hypothetical protein VFK97_01025, partial [Candidatus Saccharimonadales bacterium]|nr:hypothetical protein [Candidatus Saccharimonadales bacterium]
PARKVVRPHHLSRALEAIHGYLDAGNITGQSEAEYAEFARLAEQDPEISVAFGQLLHRIAHGGQGGINVLTQLGSSSSMQGTMKSLLGKANVDVQYDDSSTGRPVTHHGTIEEYLDEGRTAMAAQSQPVQQGASGAVGNVGGSTGRQQTGGTGGVQPVTQIINQNDGGTLVVQQPEPQVIQLQPGQVTSPGGVILSRATQDDLNSQFEIMRRELRDLKKMGQRTQEQQQRLEEIQAAHPDWKDEDEDDDEQNT